MNDAAQLDAALVTAGLGDVSRETRAGLLTFVAELRRWQPVKNLVAPGTLDAVWTRHVGDSAQLRSVAPAAKRWLDLGSGAGFPGIVMAILLAGEADAEVRLVESNSRKAAFLHAVAAATKAPAVVEARRIEAAIAATERLPEAVSARAVAPLTVLCGWLLPLSARGVPAYVHKGADFATERAEASLRWTFDLVEHPSRFGPGVIAEIRSIRPRPDGARP